MGITVRRRPVRRPTTAPSLFVGLLLLALSSVTAIPSAFATTALWNAESTDFDLDDVGCAGACHTIESPSPAIEFGSISLAADVGTVTLPRLPANGTSYSWRYRESGDGAQGLWKENETASFPVAPGGTRAIEYCLGVRDDTTARKIECGTVTLSRAAPAPVNSPPDILSRTPSGPLALEIGGAPIEVTLSVSDANDAPGDLSYSFTDAHGSVLVTETNGVFTFAPQSVGSGSVTLRVSDDDGASDSISVPFDVAPAPTPNQPPSVTASTGTAFALEVGQSRMISLTIDDETPASITIGSTADGAGVVALAGASTPMVTVTGVGAGAAAVTITVSDGSLSTVVTVTVTVEEPAPPPPDDDPPTLTLTSNGSVTLEVGESRTLPLAVTDENVAAVTVVARGGNPSVVEVVAADTDSITLRGVGKGATTLGVTAIDVAGQSSATASLAVTVEPGEPVIEYRPPSLAGTTPAGPLALEVGQSVALSAQLARGSESDVRVSASSDNETVLVVTPDGAEGAFRLAARAAGSAGVTIAAGDAPGGADAIGAGEAVTERDSLTVRVTVTEPVVDLPPVAAPDSFVFDPEDPLLPVSGNDSDPEGGALTVVLASSTSAQGAALTVDGGSVRYAPPGGTPSGEDHFDYGVRDPSGQSSDTVTVTVTTSDADGDGRADGADNCPGSPNPSQEDNDTDGVGNVCDTTPDGAGTPSFVTGGQGVELIETVCGVCHRNPATGAPQIGNRADWDARIAARGIDGIVQSAIDGRGGMQAFGGTFTARRLTEATLRMAGRVGDGTSGGATAGGTTGGTTSGPNGGTSGGTNGTTGGDGTSGGQTNPLADEDGDGYPFVLDDNDADARRLPLHRARGTPDDGSEGYIESAAPLTLGPVARALLAESDEQRGGAALSEADFARLAPTVHQGVAPENDPAVVPRGDAIDIIALGTGTVLFRVTLPAGLPNDPLLQVYVPLEGRWQQFVPDGASALASAPAIDGRCPPTADSPNYREGLVTGTRCLHVALDDGGANDVDGAANAQVPLVFRVVTQRPSGDPTSPDPVIPSSGGGGGGGAVTLVALLALLALLGGVLSKGGGRRERGEDEPTRPRALRAPLVRVPLALLGALAAAHAHAFSLTAFDLKAVADSNPAKAEFDADIEESSSIAARLSLNLLGGTFAETTQITRGYSIDAAAGYGYDVDIEGLGESVYRLSAGLFHESKTRALTPFYRLGTSVSWIDSETDIRDGPAIDVSGSINLQPSPFFDMTFGLGFESRQAETDVFDTNKANAFATANFSPALRLVLRGGVRVVVGDEVSTATPTLDIVNSALAIEPDGAFGGAEANRFAYLIDATSLILEVGAGYEITQTIQTNLLFRNVSTEADGGIAYDRNLVELTLSFDL